MLMHMCANSVFSGNEKHCTLFPVIYFVCAFCVKRKKKKKKADFYMMPIVRFHLTHRHTGIADTYLLMYIALFRDQ